MVLQVGLDRGLQFGDAAEDTAANGVLCDEAEKTLDLIEPGGRGRCEVKMDALMTSQPSLDLGVLVVA